MWTHPFDLAFKLLSAVLAFCIVQLIPAPANGSIPLAIFGVLLLFYVLYRFVFRTLATYLYCRATLKMELSLSQAAALNNAFSPVFSVNNMQWLPMKELRTAEPEHKYETALATYRSWALTRYEQRSEKIQAFKASSLQTKLLTVILFATVAFFIVASFLNLPPASYVSLLVRKVFGQGGYNPILSMVILTTPMVMLFKWVDRNIP